MLHAGRNNAALSLLMTTRGSAFVRQAVPQLPYLQFPFRWLMIATAATWVLMIVAMVSLWPLSKTRDDGNIQLVLAPGEHQLSLCFEDTPPRRAGKVISFVILMALGVMTLAPRTSR